MCGKRGAYRVLVRKSEVKKHKPGWEDNFRMGLK
jgi:hypothetical protein